MAAVTSTAEHCWYDACSLIVAVQQLDAFRSLGPAPRSQPLSGISFWLRNGKASAQCVQPAKSCTTMCADADVSSLSREQKVQLLGRLRKKLHSLALSLAAQPGMAAVRLMPPEAKALPRC